METFLREVTLEDFRTFGKFSLPIPPGPGLTLLLGTNGLGKSSFFDGIEWCLTGTIRRFQDYVGKLKESDYLTRRDAASGSHKVSLGFSEGEPLIRTATVEPIEEVLVQLLKDPRWTEIKDISAYLGFTHFLGQASQQRFTSRDKADQWQALKGPSGIDRLEAIRTALRGRSTTLAFKRRSDREEAEVALAVSALSEWQRNVSRLGDLVSRGAAAGAASEAWLDQRLADLEIELDVARNGVSRTFADRLAVVRTVIEERLRQGGQRSGAIDNLEAIVNRFREAVVLSDADGTGRLEAASKVAEATSQLSAAMIEVSDAEQAASAQTEKVARAQKDLDESIRVKTAIVDFVALEVELRAAVGSETALQVEREVCQNDNLAAQKALTFAFAAQQKLGEFDRIESGLADWARRSTKLISMEIRVRTLRDEAAKASVLADQARIELPGFQASVTAIEDEEAKATERLAVRKRDASELAELLSGIGAHITHDDISCPVCASPFSPGELQQRSRNALAAQDRHLAAEVQALADISDRLALAVHHANQARHFIEAEASAVQAATAAEDAAKEERRAIAEGLDVPIESDFERTVVERSNANSKARADHIREFGGGAAEMANAQARVDALAASLVSLNDRLLAASQRRSRCEIGLQAIENGLAGYPRPWDVDTATAAIEAKEALFATAKAALEDLTSRRAVAINTEASLRERLAATRAESSRVESVVRDAEAARLAAVTIWQREGMTGDPSFQALELQRATIAEQSAMLTAKMEDANGLLRTFEAWLAQDELRSLQARMDLEGGEGASANPTEHEQRLQERLRVAREALGFTTSTRDAVVAYGEQLKNEADSFSTKFLLPLNDLIDGFNRALLSTPGETVQFSAQHTVERTALAMQLRYADPLDNALYRTELPPQLVLSEGQMAANGFSILCAASTAYRWSRWRALLLDDPLQHNDIIHAAAFVDVMRNLVELEGYQLLMSSHKRDEGEFIARKFDAAGLPCTVVELVGASKDGVRANPPRHNAAARRLLEDPIARLA